MTTLRPATGIQQKLDDDLEKQREKAEKTALNMVSAAAKKRQSAEMKETKQRLRKVAKTRKTGDHDATRDEDIESAAVDLERAKKAERIEQDAAEALHTALDRIKQAKSVPLTVNAEPSTGSNTGAVSGAARSRFLQEALDKKRAEKNADEAATPATPTASAATAITTSPVGIQAMLAALKRNGDINSKKKVATGGGDKDKQQMVGDVLRLGRHLLK